MILVIVRVCSVGCCSFFLGYHAGVHLAVGQSVIVRYRADPQYLHERLVLGKAPVRSPHARPHRIRDDFEYAATR